MRLVAAIALPLLLLACAPDADDKGYVPIEATNKKVVEGATSAWLNCIVYGIKQVDAPQEPAATVADAAMAGCRRAETNLADKLFDGLKAHGDPRDARATADDLVRDIRVRMRENAIRLVMSKHASEGKR